jgi:hypothetical protein
MPFFIRLALELARGNEFVQETASKLIQCTIGDVFGDGDFVARSMVHPPPVRVPSRITECCDEDTESMKQLFLRTLKFIERDELEDEQRDKDGLGGYDTVDEETLDLMRSVAT